MRSTVPLLEEEDELLELDELLLEDELELEPLDELEEDEEELVGVVVPPQAANANAKAETAMCFDVSIKFLSLNIIVIL